MSQTLTLVIIYQLLGFIKHRILEAEDWNFVQIKSFVAHPRSEQAYLFQRVQ